MPDAFTGAANLLAGTATARDPGGYHAQGPGPRAFGDVAAVALLLLPLAGWVAWRLRDRAALSFVTAIATALVLSAALVGALSDVHDRYQSRIVWLAPFALLALAIRWRLWELVRDRRMRLGGPAPSEAVPLEG
jgi:hypothetical protein